MFPVSRAPILGVDTYAPALYIGQRRRSKGSVAIKLLNRSRLGDQPGGAIHRVTRPEKSGGHCEVQPGFGTAKAVIASGAVTVHASTLLTPSQESAARA